MNYIVSISYHREEIARASYSQLVKTMVTDPCHVILLDNNCPLCIDKDFLPNMCSEYGFTYLNAGENLGLHNGYNYAMGYLPDDCERFIIYDGDMFPETEDWHLPLLKIHDDERVIWSGLWNKHTYREMSERPSHKEVIMGYNCTIPHVPVIAMCCAYNKRWIDSVGGFTEPNKWYGGLEIAMWNKMPKGKIIAYLDDYKELECPVNNDDVYAQYKWEHAHNGLEMSFEEYLKNIK